MVRTDKDRIRFAVRVFLCANKGKWFSGKQLSEFLNENGFGGQAGCTSANVARLLDGNWLQSQGITRERKNGKNIWWYGVVD